MDLPVKKIFLLLACPLLSFANTPPSKLEAEKIEIDSRKKTSDFSLHAPSFESSLKSFPLPEPISKVKFDSKLNHEWKQKDGIVSYSRNIKASWSWSSDGKFEDKPEKTDSPRFKDWPPNRD